MGTRLTKAYLLTKVLTANNHEVIVYLYQGLISYMHRAHVALYEGRRGAAAAAIDRAIGIIVELSGNLNYATGGHLALRLDAIYSYLIEALTLANSRGDGEAIDACEGIAQILYDAWQQAASVEQQSPRHESRALRISA